MNMYLFVYIHIIAITNHEASVEPKKKCAGNLKKMCGEFRILPQKTNLSSPKKALTLCAKGAVGRLLGWAYA